MRVRISLSTPFNPSKILLPVPDAIHTITQLKKHLFKSLSSISTHAGSYTELKLEIDGFELLGGSEVDIVQENDVVSVGLYPGSSKTSLDKQKRKRERDSVIDFTDTLEPTSKKRKRKEKEQNVPQGMSKEVERSKKQKLTRPMPGLGPSATVAPKAVIPLEPAVGSTTKRFRTVDKESVTNQGNVAHGMISKKTGTTTRRRPSVSSTSSSSSSPSSSVSSSESESYSSSSSDSSSSSSSTSSSSDTDSSSEANHVLKSQAKSTNPQDPFPVNINPTPTPSVPPGTGKPSTHDRNLRRRKARLYRKQAEVDSSLSQSVTPIPNIGENAMNGHVTTATSVDPSLVPATMSNRNKKKGFLKEMLSMKGSKTVFDAQDVIPVEEISQEELPPTISTNMITAIQNKDGQVADTQNLPMDVSPVPRTIRDGVDQPEVWTPSMSGSGRKPKGRRIIPPSEMNNLPTNIFVSSATFESPGRAYGGPQSIGSTPQRYRNNEMREEHTFKEDSVRPGHVEVAGAEETEEAEEEIVVDQEVDTGAQSLFWTKVDIALEAFDSLTKPLALTLPEGSLIAWKEVTLDLTTFTPELKLQIAKITSRSEEVLTLEKLQRSVDVADVADDAIEIVEEVEGPEEVYISLEELSSSEGKWKIVPAEMKM